MSEHHPHKAKQHRVAAPSPWESSSPVTRHQSDSATPPPAPDWLTQMGTGATFGALHQCVGNYSDSEDLAKNSPGVNDQKSTAYNGAPPERPQTKLAPKSPTQLPVLDIFKT